MKLSASILYIAKQQGIESVDFEKDVILQDDGNGPYIKHWGLGIPMPESGALAIANEAVGVEDEANSYIALRIAEYPPIQEQLDEIYWDLKNGTTVWVDKITVIKVRHPKP